MCEVTQELPLRVKHYGRNKKGERKGRREGENERERVGGERQANNGIATLNYVYLFCV